MAAEGELKSDTTSSCEASREERESTETDEAVSESNSQNPSSTPSVTTSGARKGSTYREHCEESFKELRGVVTSSVAEFVENTTMSDVVEVLEEENVLDRLKSAILDHL